MSLSSAEWQGLGPVNAARWSQAQRNFVPSLSGRQGFTQL